MKAITSVNHLTLSISDAHAASKNSCKSSVALAKGDEETSIVIKAFRPNSRTERTVKLGYQRQFASKAVWIETLWLNPNLSVAVADGRTLDEVVCRDFVARAVAAANASANVRIAIDVIR